MDMGSMVFNNRFCTKDLSRGKGLRDLMLGRDKLPARGVGSGVLNLHDDKPTQSVPPTRERMDCKEGTQQHDCRKRETP